MRRYRGFAALPAMLCVLTCAGALSRADLRPPAPVLAPSSVGTLGDIPPPEPGLSTPAKGMVVAGVGLAGAAILVGALVIRKRRKGK